MSRKKDSNENESSDMSFNNDDFFKKETKKLIQDYVAHTKKLNTEIKLIADTKPYKMAYLSRKFIHEFLKGSWNDRKIFIKWISSKFFNRKTPPQSGENPLLSLIKFNNEKIKNLNTFKEELTNLDRAMEELDRILLESNFNFVDLFVLKCGWNMDLFQRPQHISINFSDLGGLVLFRGAYDGVDQNMVKPIHKIKKNLYLLDMDHEEFFNYIADKLTSVKKPKILHLYSTDNEFEMSEIEKFEKMGFKILYEYVDEISPDISQKSIPDETYLKHESILKNTKYIIITTADKLYQEVYQVRKSFNLISSSNGVEYSHWKIEKEKISMPADIKTLIESRMPIIGYYGAIAPWMDYVLVEKLLKERPGYQVVFIGQILNSSFSEDTFSEYHNFHFLGVKSYYELNNYAIYFDVCMIPFIVNEITESTSPIKLFEYMALNKPIVTTDLYECRKYDSVMIGNSHDEFISKIDLALEKRNNKDYLELLKKEALENTWKRKTLDIMADLGLLEVKNDIQNKHHHPPP